MEVLVYQALIKRGEEDKSSSSFTMYYYSIFYKIDEDRFWFRKEREVFKRSLLSSKAKGKGRVLESEHHTKKGMQQSVSIIDDISIRAEEFGCKTIDVNNYIDDVSDKLRDLKNMDISKVYLT